MNFLGQDIPDSVIEAGKRYIRSKRWFTEKLLAHQVEAAWPTDSHPPLEVAGRIRLYAVQHIVAQMEAAGELKREKPYRGGAAWSVRQPVLREGDTFRRRRYPIRGFPR